MNLPNTLLGDGLALGSLSLTYKRQHDAIDGAVRKRIMQYALATCVAQPTLNLPRQITEIQDWSPEGDLISIFWMPKDYSLNGRLTMATAMLDNSIFRAYVVKCYHTRREANQAESSATWRALGDDEKKVLADII